MCASRTGGRPRRGGSGHVAYVKGLRLAEEASARLDRRERWFFRVSGQVGGLPDLRVS